MCPEIAIKLLYDVCSHDCQSGSFYPQPISNYTRKSTLGLAIDFPTLNVLGFCMYTVSTASFLYSPTIRAQYAHRHPETPETTVRFNDFLFAAHGAVMCIVCYSQFFPWIWGFQVGKTQRASKAVLGIFWGCVVAIIWTILMVRWRGRDGGYDADAWAWIDVVSASANAIASTMPRIEELWLTGDCRSTSSDTSS